MVRRVENTVSNYRRPPESHARWGAEQTKSHLRCSAISSSSSPDSERYHVNRAGMYTTLNALLHELDPLYVAIQQFQSERDAAMLQGLR